MLVIRMQRTGRKGHAMFRVVVQDSRRTPTSGKIVASLGSYDPHSKNVTLNTEKAQFYLDHGAQPSERVAALLKAEGVKLPKWVQLSGKKSSAVRNPEKLRRNRPAEPAATAEEPVTEESAQAEPEGSAATEATETQAAEAAETTSESPAEAPAETPESAETSSEEPATEASAEEAATEDESVA